MFTIIKFEIGVFLDRSKAFDTVDHAILLLKMFIYGFHGNVHKWVSNYVIYITQKIVQAHGHFFGRFCSAAMWSRKSSSHKMARSLPSPSNSWDRLKIKNIYNK